MEHVEWCKEQFKFRKLELGLEVNQKVSNPVDLEDTKPTAMWRWGWQEDQQYLLGDQRREVHDYRKFGLEVQYTKDNASSELILKDTHIDHLLTEPLENHVGGGVNGPSVLYISAGGETHHLPDATYNRLADATYNRYNTWLKHVETINHQCCAWVLLPHFGSLHSHSLHG